MNKPSSFGLLAACAATLLATAGSARATVLYNSGNTTFPTSGTATQVGRLVRNGIPQDFSGTEVYPGTNNPTITFNYTTYTFTAAQLAGFPDVQIELDSQGLGIFASAYLNSFTPGTSFQTNWLGDQGSSGNYFVTSPTLRGGNGDVSFFGVNVPAGNNLVVVIATAGAANGTVGTGQGTAYNLEVEKFGDTTYNPNAVPEPSSLVAAGLGLVGLGLAARRRVAKNLAA